MDQNELIFADDKPYPPIDVCKKNRQYASMMLDNVGGSNSEISAVCLYVYNNLVTEAECSRIAEIYHKISIVEMHHLKIFGQLALALGKDPRWWTQRKNRMKYWTPSYDNYSFDLKILVNRSLNGELATIKKYKQQIAFTDDQNIADNLNRIILDEQIHVSIFERMISSYHL